MGGDLLLEPRKFSIVNPGLWRKKDVREDGGEGGEGNCPPLGKLFKVFNMPNKS